MNTRNPDFELDSLISFAHHLADLSAEVIRPHFRSNCAIDQKIDGTPATEADLRAEQVMRQAIGERYPDHGIVGEEIKNQGEERRFVWVLDPIDGTKAFIAGSPLFGTLIGLLNDHQPVLGLINQPVLNERWVGIQDSGTTFNGKPIRTRKTTRLKDARFAFTSPHMFNATEKNQIEHLSKQVAQTTFGGDCYAYGLLANGHIDIIIEASLHPHDYMALIPVVENAGGIITDWQGKLLTLHGEGKVIACANASLHEQVLKKLEHP